MPKGTNCTPHVADLFLFCYKRDFMLSHSNNYQADVVEVFYSTSRYLVDDLLNVDNPFCEQMVRQIYPTELQLNEANSLDSEAPFLDLHLSITYDIVSYRINDKQDDLYFEIINFLFLDGDIPRSPSYGVYISQRIRFARVCSNVDEFNNRNKFLACKMDQSVFVSCASHAFASVHCCLVVTCLERAELFAQVGDVSCIFVTFSCGILGQVWYLIVSFSDLCHLFYF